MARRDDPSRKANDEPAALAGLARLADWWRELAMGREEPEGLNLAVAGVLVLLSVPYGIGAAVSLWFRALRPARFDVPVISVGNIVAGGAGKTPRPRQSPSGRARASESPIV